MMKSGYYYVQALDGRGWGVMWMDDLGNSWLPGDVACLTIEDVAKKYTIIGAVRPPPAKMGGDKSSLPRGFIPFD